MHCISIWSNMVTIYWSNPQDKETQSMYIQTTSTNYQAELKCAQGHLTKTNSHGWDLRSSVGEGTLLNICLVQLLILCHLNFNIPVHKHKSSLPKSPCYHQWKQYIEVSRNSRFIQVLIKLCRTLSKLKIM
jgi:hypothetical protein